MGGVMGSILGGVANIGAGVLGFPVLAVNRLGALTRLLMATLYWTFVGPFTGKTRFRNSVTPLMHQIGVKSLFIVCLVITLVGASSSSRPPTSSRSSARRLRAAHDRHRHRSRAGPPDDGDRPLGPRRRGLHGGSRQHGHQRGSARAEDHGHQPGRLPRRAALHRHLRDAALSDRILQLPPRQRRRPTSIGTTMYGHLRARPTSLERPRSRHSKPVEIIAADSLKAFGLRRGHLHDLLPERASACAAVPRASAAIP